MLREQRAGRGGGGGEQVMYTCDMEAAGPFRCALGRALCIDGRGRRSNASRATERESLAMRLDGARAGCLLRRIKIESFEGRKHDLTEGFAAEHAEQVAACMHLRDLLGVHASQWRAGARRARTQCRACTPVR